ncbi:helix-turn-helix domain-containing protein [Nocardia mexicana]|uniref:helix-turn-helix domain-containing protein n=1 Tax=Nocardia mexicana TaxID=279262 RepID=UPI000AEE7F13|nr:helix-turn-helix domain-containing protein [Nocardia mexicana]
MKQWEPDWLGKVIQKIEAAPLRRHGKTDSSTVQPRRLDRRLSPATITELVDAYRDGTSTNQLCDEYGLSKGGLLKIFQEHGVQMRYQPMTEEEIDWAVRLYGEGQSLNAVARQLDKSKGSVWRALRGRKVEMRPSTRPTYQ